MPNGVIVIDKAPDWTSHDVVAKLRGVLKCRRVGHGGTLDPMATGVLPVFVGRATRAADFAAAGEKEYTAVLRLGEITDTQDITGTVLERRDASGISLSDLESVLPRFTGDIFQMPPMYSAIKVDGQKLYTLSRKGVEVERKSRPINIASITARELGGGEFELKITCSKGTYVRTLCHDIGQALGCGGTMAALRRTRVGGFTEDMALGIENASEEAIIPVDTLFSEYSALTLDEKGEKLCRCGGVIATKEEQGLYRVYGPGGFLMLGRVEAGKLITVKNFFEV